MKYSSSNIEILCCNSNNEWNKSDAIVDFRCIIKYSNNTLKFDEKNYEFFMYENLMESIDFTLKIHCVAA